MSWTPDVFNGVGIFTSIFCPSKEGLKLLFRTTFTSIFVRPTSLTSGITRKGSEISLVVRYLNKNTFFINIWWWMGRSFDYLMSSNSPSGGIKLMECSVSNLLSFTHWWNWQSSITTTGFPDRADSASEVVPNEPLPLASITILSLIPNLHSGIPDK